MWKRDEEVRYIAGTMGEKFSCVVMPRLRLLFLHINHSDTKTEKLIFFYCCANFPLALRRSCDYALPTFPVLYRKSDSSTHFPFSSCWSAHRSFSPFLLDPFLSIPLTLFLARSLILIFIQSFRASRLSSSIKWEFRIITSDY